MDNKSRAQNVKMILMDVDGTLTDGTLIVMPDGEELKSYHVKDGLGILLAYIAGFKTGIITGKTSKALEKRAARLKIMELYQGVLDKKQAFFKIIEKYSLKPEEIAYIGDDLGDLDVIKLSGFSGAVADAHPLIKENSHYLCDNSGGKGAVREFIEFILDAQDKWGLVQSRVHQLKDKEEPWD